MSKKNVLVVLILCATLLSQMANRCFADIKDDQQQASQYYKNKDYTQAETAYKQIVSSYPAAYHAVFMAQIRLICIYIATNNDTDAQSVYNKLNTDYSSRTELPASLFHISSMYEAQRKYTKTTDICNQIINNYSSSSYASKAEITIPKVAILYLVDSGSYSAADIAVDSMISSYSDNSDLGKGLYGIAVRYEQVKEWQRAEDVYIKITQNCPSATGAGFAAARINARLVIKSGSDGSADAAVSSLLTDFSSHPDMAKVLFELAYNYRCSEKYDKTKGLYQKIVQRYPSSAYALKAQIGVGAMDILLSIKSKDYSSAQDAVSSLVTSFSGNLGLAEALCSIAIGYEHAKEYTYAKGVYQQIVQQRPNSQYATEARLDIPRTDIMSSILAENYTVAASKTNSLITNFASHSNLARALYSIANRYEDSGQYQLAEAEYERIAQQYSASEQAGKAQLDVRKCQVLGLFESGNDSGALAEIDSLITDFADSSYLAYAVSRKVAEKYYIEAFKLQSQGSENQAVSMFQRSLIVWLKVISGVPVSGETTHALYWAADCHRKLGNYEQSIECYKKVANDYPAHKLASYALFSAGRNYANMKALRLLSKSEADAGTKAAYQRLADTYPDYKATKQVRSWLTRHNSN